jgi:ABC-type multidrug transport system fused ATPase/permease subunit
MDIRCTDHFALRYSAGDFARSSGASDRVFGLLTRLGPTGSGRGGTRLARVRGELELRHVWFRYQTATQTQWALQNVTLRMEPGSVVALVRRRELDGLN